MSEKTVEKTREKWVDDVKGIACILVVLGHFFQSMTKANILPDNDLYEWFNTTIYYFHVPLFFICSGYLYQKYSKKILFVNISLVNGGAEKSLVNLLNEMPEDQYEIDLLLFRKKKHKCINTSIHIKNFVIELYFIFMLFLILLFNQKNLSSSIKHKQ